MKAKGVIRLEGLVFERLTVVSESGQTAAGSVKWNCLCSCGHICIVDGQHLRNGHTRSCGCLMREASRIRSAARVKHGHTRNYEMTSEYHIWCGVKQRCDNPKAPSYPNYGGRGIRLFCGWSESFESFIAYVGKRPSKKHSLDRYPDPNGNYEPGNVRWANGSQQQRNRRNTPYLTIGGITKPRADWADSIGISSGALGVRLAKGLTPELAVSFGSSKGSRAMKREVLNG